jgi:hypothetical protein
VSPCGCRSAAVFRHEAADAILSIPTGEPHHAAMPFFLLTELGRAPSLCSTVALLCLSRPPLLTSPFLTAGHRSPIRAEAEAESWRLPAPCLLPSYRAHRHRTTSTLSPRACTPVRLPIALPSPALLQVWLCSRMSKSFILGDVLALMKH